MNPFAVKIALIMATVLFSGFAAVAVPAPPPQTIATGTLSMAKLSTVANQTSPGCFSGYVAMNITWTNSNVTYPVSVQSFFITVSAPNQVVGNSTSTSYKSPSNTFLTLLVFPNLPVTFRVSFVKVCGTPSTLKLVYIDPNFSFSFQLP